ncbi:angiopoietin-related protein 3-like isoform X2 [Musca domestica]|uniref:Angiopoietin-related protein 3-like isoform X2 n=1 Tax=Musca domestica TaxID=7370 RepID=A0ABM3VJT3_MUSDO|nr:angiopoietin-related protein 3-like isoform X2 [Musca domestica]
MMRFLWLLLLIIHATYAGEKQECVMKEYLDPNDSQDNAFLWKNLFIKLNKVVEATEKLEQNFESINKRLDELTRSQWTTIMRRKDGSVNFNRNWNEYKNGFGNPDADFFVGLEMLHRLTTEGKPQELLVVLVDFEDETRYARYDSFG